MRPRRAVGQRRTSIVLWPFASSAAQGCFRESAYCFTPAVTQTTCRARRKTPTLRHTRQEIVFECCSRESLGGDGL
jgi:hypothetical protein